MIPETSAPISTTPPVPPPQVSPPAVASPPVVQPPSLPYLPSQLPSTVAGISSEPPAIASNSDHREQLFVIPTIDGGQAVIREPTRVAVSGGKRRQLRNMTAAERATRRTIKNCVVFGLCALLLMSLLWWLLWTGPL